MSAPTLYTQEGVKVTPREEMVDAVTGGSVLSLPPKECGTFRAFQTNDTGSGQ